jgi:tryptophanyl-tRNA synthetase
MSKSYQNVIELREAPATTEEKIRTMQTDPARVRRTDPGNPEICPVFGLHEIYSDDETLRWATEGCTSAGIGCIDCKMPLIEAIVSEQAERRERAEQFEGDPGLVHSILLEGSEKARDVAKETIEDVRAAIGLSS